MAIAVRIKFLTVLGAALSLNLLSACTFTPVMGLTETTPPPTAIVAAPQLGVAGFGDFQFGQPVDTSRPDVVVMGEPVYACAYARVNNESGPLMLMLIDGRLARIDIEGPEGRNQALANGLTIGSSVAEIKAVYGARAVATPNKYDEHGTNYEISLSDTVGVVLETSEDKVTTFRIGRHEEVRWVEGCS